MALGSSDPVTVVGPEPHVRRSFEENFCTSSENCSEVRLLRSEDDFGTIYLFQSIGSSVMMDL